MTLTVHHLQVSQSDRVVWLCEELGIDYELKLHQRDPLLSPPEIKALHPLGAAPIIQDTTFVPEGSPPLVLAESAACIEYIAQKHGNGRLILKPDHPNYADYLYWFHFANGSLQPVIGRVFAISRIVDADHPSLKNFLNRRHLALDQLNDRLKTVTWLAGDDFTAADVMTVFSLTTMRKFAPYDLGPYPAVLAYLKRVSERPALKKAMEKGDPGMELGIHAESPPQFEAISQLK